MGCRTNIIEDGIKANCRFSQESFTEGSELIQTKDFPKNTLFSLAQLSLTNLNQKAISISYRMM